MSSSSSRAAEVLERFSREHPRRNLYHRDELGPPPDPDATAESTGGADRRSGARLVMGRIAAPARMLGLLGVVACVGVVLAGLALDRRAPPIDEQLPLASESATSGAGATGTGASGTGASAPGATGVASGAGDSAEPGAADGAAQAEGTVVVHVAGAVAAPGVVDLPAGSRVVDAVRAAGGLRPDADTDRVNLAALLQDAQRVVVPVIGQEVPVEAAPPSPGTGSGGPGGAGRSGDGSPSAGPVDLNTADAAALETLPGVGPATSAAIVDHREREGPFRSVDALLDVRGIGEAKLEALRDLVTVGGT